MMSPVIRFRVLVVVLLATALLAQEPAAIGSGTLPSGQCTDLSGKVSKPCPSEVSSGTAGLKSSAGADHCTNLAGKEVPCPSAVGTDPGAMVMPAPAAAAVSCTNLSGKEVPCPDSTGSAVPSTGEFSSSASSARCTNLAGKDAACPADINAGSLTMVHPTSTGASLERSLPRNLVEDQKLFWSSPSRLREKDLHWLLPFSVVTAGLIGNDRGIESHLPDDPNTIRRSKNFSNYGAAGFVAGAGALYLWGRATDNAHMRETGWLAGEALLNGLGISYAMKGITTRNRPLVGNGRGSFWTGSNPFNSSFPSQHAVAAWSVASVVAHEYPSPFTQFLAYGAAAAVSATRVTGRQHWASDAFIGSALGWYMGRQVYRAHAGGEDRSQWGTFESGPRETARDPADMGSPYVPLDSWVYPAIERLAALGYIQTAFMGLRPWTRMECARLLEEAQSAVDEEGRRADSSDAVRLYQALAEEFAPESARRLGARNSGAEIESIYTRFTGLSGRPLTDGYHFGQTLTNDYGRPYRQGANLVMGISSHAVAGPLTLYVRTEYQHSPSSPPLSDSERQLIAGQDANPLQPATPFATLNQARLLDSYVGITLSNIQISFGKQSLWWGPGDGSALMFSNNAEPFYMLRVSRTTPLKLPSILGLLGPMRSEFFIGRLQGHHFPTSPYIDAQKISFMPTPNLELGFSKLDIFGGGRVPLIWRSFWRSIVSVGSNPSSDLPGRDAGDRRGGFDFRYRVPGLRKWLVLFSDSLADDDPSPIAAPRRSVFNPGIYLSRIPGLPKLDFRAEAAYTDATTSQSVGGQFIYWNTNFHDSHTNKGNILGSWVGREGRGLQLSSTYWLSAQNTVRFGYRHFTVSNDFLPGGGTLNDGSVRAEFKLRPVLTFSTFVQYEHLSFPALSLFGKSNVAASLQLTFRPHRRPSY